MFYEERSDPRRIRKLHSLLLLALLGLRHCARCIAHNTQITGTNGSKIISRGKVREREKKEKKGVGGGGGGQKDTLIERQK